jgi:hypothetical protein
MKPLQGLLKKANAYVWGPEHEDALEAVKAIITNPEGPVLRHFNPKLPIQLLTDTSRTGLGYCLTQTEVGCKSPLLITAGSRFLSPAEDNYAVVELELLAIHWAIDKCRLYLAGAEFLVVTDNQPLLGILNRKNLDAVNITRIQRLLAKLLGYTFKVKWVPGKNHVIADALSRAPAFAAEGHEEIIIRKVAEVVPDPALTELAERAKLDEDYQRVVVAVGEKPVVKDLNKRHPAQRYRAHWDAMAVEGSYQLLTYHNRILAPEAARPNILSSLHIQHTGRVKTLMNARQLYFWPGMTKDIKRMVSRCEKCTLYLPSQSLESQIETTASRPFEKVSVDLGHYHGQEYVILADR